MMKLYEFLRLDKEGFIQRVVECGGIKRMREINDVLEFFNIADAKEALIPWTSDYAAKRRVIKKADYAKRIWFCRSLDCGTLTISDIWTSDHCGEVYIYYNKDKDDAVYDVAFVKKIVIKETGAAYSKNVSCIKEIIDD